MSIALFGHGGVVRPPIRVKQNHLDMEKKHSSTNGTMSLARKNPWIFVKNPPSTQSSHVGHPKSSIHVDEASEISSIASGWRFCSGMGATRQMVQQGFLPVFTAGSNMMYIYHGPQDLHF